jgi:hypothetical protein
MLLFPELLRMGKRIVINSYSFGGVENFTADAPVVWPPSACALTAGHVLSPSHPAYPQPLPPAKPTWPHSPMPFIPPARLAQPEPAETPAAPPATKPSFLAQIVGSKSTKKEERPKEPAKTDGTNGKPASSDAPALRPPGPATVLPLKQEDTEVVKLVTARTTSLAKDRYAPEIHLCSFLDQEFPASAPHQMYASYARSFTPMGLYRWYSTLCRAEKVDAVLLVDGGSDSLMVGDEAGLGDPIEVGTLLVERPDQAAGLCFCERGRMVGLSSSRSRSAGGGRRQRSFQRG